MNLASKDLKRVIEDRSITERENYKNRRNFEKICNDLVQGLAYLCYGNPPHSLIHGDIKPENVLLIKDRFVISDFGTARVILSCINFRKNFFSRLK